VIDQNENYIRVAGLMMDFTERREFTRAAVQYLADCGASDRLIRVLVIGVDCTPPGEGKLDAPEVRRLVAAFRESGIY